MRPALLRVMVLPLPFPTGLLPMLATTKWQEEAARMEAVSMANMTDREESMGIILVPVALGLVGTGCTAATSNSAPDKAQRTQDERARESQCGGSYCARSRDVAPRTR